MSKVTSTREALRQLHDSGFGSSDPDMVELYQPTAECLRHAPEAVQVLWDHLTARLGDYPTAAPSVVVLKALRVQLQMAQMRAVLTADRLDPIARGRVEMCCAIMIVVHHVPMEEVQKILAP